MGIVTKVTGVMLVLVSCASFSGVFVWMIGAKVLGTVEENSVLKFMQKDQYYCFLIPMMIPTTFILVYANWVSMKFFRHN
jgi:phosphatidylinositol N-acetylglucosaminyltransferase subunit Y